MDNGLGRVSDDVLPMDLRCDKGLVHDFANGDLIMSASESRLAVVEGKAHGSITQHVVHLLLVIQGW